MVALPSSLAAFDPSRHVAATKLRLIGRAQALPDDAATVARMMNFTGEVGQILPVGGEILVGTGSGAEPFALGSAAAMLTAGDYAVEGPVTALDALGWALGAYRFAKYKKVAAPPTLVLPGDADVDAIGRMARAAILVRDLVNTPAEAMGPDALEGAARALAEKHKASVHVTVGDDLADDFPLIDAVGRAAAIPPRLIDLHWGKLTDPAITLVGKGVCFDSGGLNIKNASGMALMKKDMGGAANALGLAKMIMEARLPISLRVLIPAVENAISGNAFRPGDVFRSRSGQTVEISNTDAEGRLILADALSFAAEDKPTRIISMATLTGAARVALGPDITPVYSTDTAFSDALVAAGQKVADPLWPMPLWARYDDFLTSQIADVNHASPNGFAGSITAALFLRRFVPAEIPYTHFDLFAWVPAARPGRPVGGEAMAIRAVFEVLQAR